MELNNMKIGFALTGSFCTFDAILLEMENILKTGASITPIISEAVNTMDNRFNTAQNLKIKLEGLTNNKIIKSIQEAEPIGPKNLFDIIVVAPATGNTLAKLANGITDTAVTMAVKSHLRNNKPVVLGISTNDGLGNSAKNIGMLLNAKHMYFVPFGQDDPEKKEKSLVLKTNLIIPTILKAMEGKQIQPLIM